MQALNENAEIKNAISLNVNVFGLSQPSDKQPTVPFVSMNQINLASEQLTLSKVIGPNFKGSVTATQNVFPLA
jgi:hypothetical protein